MKIRITDLAAGCCPSDVLPGEYDRALAEHINRRVLQQLTMEETRRPRRLPKAFLLAAVLILMIGTVAFAAAEYSMSFRRPGPDDAVVSGFRFEEVVDGKVWNSRLVAYPDAGMVFTFTVPEKAAFTPEFRCFWLPQEPTEGITDTEGWTKRLFCDAGDQIPYSIMALDYLSDGLQLVISGDVTVAGEMHWEDWQVLEVSSDCSKLTFPTYDRANFILLYQESTGYLVLISGELEMETLEHIAREMEIRDSSTPRPDVSGGASIGTLDLGRG